VGSALTSAFNEYIVLAWFAKNSNPSFANYNRAQAYWTNVYSDPTKSIIPKYSYPAGNQLISGGNYAQPSFQIQFAYYYCNYFSNNSDYMNYFKNQAVADRTWWKNTTGQKIAWGNGAGEIPGGGYSADAINNNPDRIVSPHIMAGFSPVDAGVKNDLIALYNNGNGSAVYKIPGSNIEFLWRYKLNSPAARGAYVQAVDFSTMIYGLAALPEYLGADFFKKYNDFNYDPTTSVSELNKGKDNLSIYPNPFATKTKVAFELQEKSSVRIDIYSEKGEMIRTLIKKSFPAGKHSVEWDTKDELSKAVIPGAYFCRLTINNKPFQTKQLLLVK
jgi:hypothetical protein